MVVDDSGDSLPHAGPSRFPAETQLRLDGPRREIRALLRAQDHQDRRGQGTDERAAPAAAASHRIVLIAETVNMFSLKYKE